MEKPNLETNPFHRIVLTLVKIQFLFDFSLNSLTIVKWATISVLVGEPRKLVVIENSKDHDESLEYIVSQELEKVYRHSCAFVWRGTIWFIRVLEQLEL